MHHDPNTPDLEPVPTEPPQDESQPQESSAEETSLEALPPSDEFVQQTDIAEPLEATIPEKSPEDLPPPPTHITDEVFQQADIAEPFEASIPWEILEGPDGRKRRTATALLPVVRDEAFIASMTQASNDNDEHLFDDDYAQPPTSAPDTLEPPSETSFEASEFGPSTGLTASPSTDEPAQRTFDDLTLSEVVSLFFRRPRATWRALIAVLQDSSEEEAKKNAAPILELSSASSSSIASRFRPEQLKVLRSSVTMWDLATLSLSLMAYVLALMGCIIFISEVLARREEAEQLVRGFPYVAAGALAWFFAELIQHRLGIRAWIQTRRPINWTLMGLRLVPIALFLWILLRWMDASDAPYDQTQQALDAIMPTFPLLIVGVVAWLAIDVVNRWARTVYPSQQYLPTFTEIQTADLSSVNENPTSTDVEKPKNALLFRIPDLEELDLFRITAAICGTILAAITYIGTAGNHVSDPIFYAWITSAMLWAVALSPTSWHPRNSIHQWRERIQTSLRQRPSFWIVAAVVVIAFLAVVMRTDRLYGDPVNGTRIPPEMTSDHVEKILDGQRVLEGPTPSCPNCNRDIFFANNGGREPFQMYALAFLANLTNRDVDYNLIKTLALMESLISIPIIGWLAWEILATEKRSLRLTFALLVMALVAVSYWHLNVTRLALRIILTPSISALVMIYMARAMRHNHRADFIKAGIWLGVGLYMYQAVRMLPVVIVAGVVMAAYFGTIRWRERGKYALNLAALVLISFVIFIPMFHYSVENPDMFLRRTAGRLFGDEIVTTTLDNGTVVERRATTEEQLAAFQKNLPVLLSNMRNALLMFQWKGDVAWINNAPNYPALDPFVGALLILGVVAWGSLAVRRGDVVYAFVPVVILIMLLPSALSIAYPIENPSFTRTSGALPAVFLLAAYPLALMFENVNSLFDRRIIRQAAGIALSLVIIASFSYSMTLYTTKFVQSYISSSLPYSQAGQILRGFATSDGSFGNAFMIAYTYWWDHRALGLEAGLTDWPNGIVTRGEVPTFLNDAYNRAEDTYRFDPQKDILFFYSPFDLDTSAALKEWFPEGQEREVVAYQPGDNFMMYRVPALGSEGFQSFIAQNIP